MSRCTYPLDTHVRVCGKEMEVPHIRVDNADETILLLHEALGSVSYWRDFPERLARTTGCNVLCYSRPGHGNSEGPLEQRNEAHYRRQVGVVIPALLHRFGIERPTVYGHSEGAAIALLYAAHTNRLKALVLESPFVVPDANNRDYILRLRASYSGSRMQERLAHYHREADKVFHSWAQWAGALSERNLLPDSMLMKIDCPVLALQGAKDEFGTTAHLKALYASIPWLDLELFPDTGHLPHRERTDSLLARVAEFLKRPRTPARNHNRQQP